MINAVILTETLQLRLFDRVLAPLHGRDALYPGQLLEVRLDRLSEKPDDFGFIVRVKMDHRLDDYNYVDADTVMIDMHAARTHPARGTRAHAVRCAVADLRRVAEGLARSDAEAALAITGLQQRLPLYTEFDDLRQDLTMVAATVLATLSPAPRQRPWQRPDFKQDMLDAIQRGNNQPSNLTLTAQQRDQQRAFLTSRAAKPEAANL